MFSISKGQARTMGVLFISGLIVWIVGLLFVLVMLGYCLFEGVRTVFA